MLNTLALQFRPLARIGVFDWATTPTTSLQLRGNELSSIETGDFSGFKVSTRWAWLSTSLTSIEPGEY